jgi:hypothetical protein
MIYLRHAPKLGHPSRNLGRWPRNYDSTHIKGAHYPGARRIDHRQKTTEVTYRSGTRMAAPKADVRANDGGRRSGVHLKSATARFKFGPRGQNRHRRTRDQRPGMGGGGHHRAPASPTARSRWFFTVNLSDRRSSLLTAHKGIVFTPGSPPPFRARPERRQDARSARGMASTTHSRARPHGRTRPRRHRPRARRRCRA